MRGTISHISSSLRRFIPGLFLLALGLVPSTAHADVHLWPVFEVSKDELSILYPLFSHDDSMTMIFPLYYGFPKEEEHHLLWPLVKVKEGRVTRVFPSWFQEEGGDFLFFPFAARTSGKTFLLLPPMLLDEHGSLQALFPFYIRSTGSTSAKGQTESTQHILWPIYSRSDVKDEDGNLVSRNRRWLIFSESVDEKGTHERRILGLPIWERTHGS